MRPSNKRSRSKSNRPKPLGNIVNRVFDSSGPEGKVRGTPQQIIDKYLVLARDAQLSGDRVAAENFLQHAEHYLRMLSEAQREMARESEVRREQFQQPQFGNGQSRRHDQRDQDQRDSEVRGSDGRWGDQRSQDQRSHDQRGHEQRGGDTESREAVQEQQPRHHDHDSRERSAPQPNTDDMSGVAVPAETRAAPEAPAEPRRNRRAGRPPRAEPTTSDPRDTHGGQTDDGESMLVETPESRAEAPPETQATLEPAPEASVKPRAPSRRAPRKPRTSGPADASRAAE